MRDAMAAEWVKLRSIRSTWLCLAAGVVVSVLGAITLGGAAAMESEHVQATEPVVSVILFSQYAAIALAVLAVTTEYASGTIRPTLQAVPVRGRMLAAKALVVAPVLFAAGVLTGAAAALATYLVLLAPVFRSAPALAPAETAADLLRLGVFHALVGVLAVGVSAALRGSAGSLAALFMATLGLPLLLVMTGVPAAVEVSLRLPTFAGMAFLGSTDNLTGGPLPYPPGEGLAWLAAWTALAVAAGYAVLRRRDA
ncbi:ABC transporter permease [Nonomuraea ferruginea]|uniref:ABC transporter permease subunit n=1 Tax=Nonomuraea ferruginea TaxID=46174 RepID=A0ABT4T503_9ACTN|nr:ABC transporter permease [Nonomuraea ferruginea]MDA0644238.1 ABC transporter permease subunit [Nonomuraea ferruginea]